MNQEEVKNNTEPAPVTRKKRLFRYLFPFLIVLCILGPLYGLSMYSRAIRSVPEKVVTAQADCAVVLTGGAGRVREGIALLSHKQVKKLIISGVHQRSTLGDMFPEVLFYPEIDLDQVILERRSSSTAGNAQQSLAIVEALKCQSILLVTSDYHMFRALKTFQQAFPPSIQIVPYTVPSDKLYYSSFSSLNTRFWGTVTEEAAKYLLYWFFVF